MSPTSSESPLSSIHGSALRDQSVTRRVRCSGRCPAAASARNLQRSDDDLGDARTLGPGDLQVDVDVPTRVDHDGLAGVAEHIGGAAEIAMQDLTEEHEGSFPGQ